MKDDECGGSRISDNNDRNYLYKPKYENIEPLYIYGFNNMMSGLVWTS